MIKKTSHICISILITFFSCHSKEYEKEVWEIPCNYTGRLIVYFASEKDKQNPKANERLYLFNQKGVSLVKWGKNDGFIKNINEVIQIRMKCDSSIITIPYIENSKVTLVDSGFFATNLITGRLGGVPYKSIYIVIR